MWFDGFIGLQSFIFHRAPSQTKNVSPFINYDRESTVLHT